jgi:ectoine hydroxylase
VGQTQGVHRATERLTDRQREEFEDQGYLVVEDALDRPSIERLTQATDRIRREHASCLSDGASLHLKGFVPLDEAFLDLLDHPKTFPPVVDLLGWNIFLYHCHLDVNPPLSGIPPARWGWHQDGGRMNEDIEGHPRPRMSVKVAFFLSDLSEPGRGNLHVLPGSHRLASLPRPANGATNPRGAVPVLGAPGTAVLFDRRLWHARGDNRSDVTRKVLFLAYSYRWVRPRDEFRFPNGFLERLDPVRRQLLGASTGALGHYVPTDEDVPVRALDHHLS